MINNKKHLPHIRFNEFADGRIIVTTVFWESILLKEDEFNEYIAWNIPKDSELYKDLLKRWFINYDWYESEFIEDYKHRFWINFIWPTLHIMILTKWCNHQCKYCHAWATMDYENDDIKLKKEDAEKTVDIILQSPSKFITIEFQWWEPFSNFWIIEHIIKYTEEANKKTKKNIWYALVSNLTMLDDEILEKLFTFPNLGISTSLDWPKKVHDFNRVMSWGKNSSSYELLAKNIWKIRAKEKETWISILRWAMWVITKKSLPFAKEIIDTYLEFWFESIFLKRMNTIGKAENKWNILGYTFDEYNIFLDEYFKELLKKYKEWIFVLDVFLSITIKKILTPENINYVDLRSPCWAWVSQIAYNHDWKVYTCDEWRMIEDDVFQLWTINDSLKDLVQSETTWIMMDASTIESLPCDVCAYAPFCGVCPVVSYMTKWNIYYNQNNDDHCKFFTYYFDMIFRVLSDKEKYADEYEYFIKHLR
ncbi:MAG: hypothetical protein ACD_3C00051G0010 [uncultured bacterium (gcode 4)]|uniref:Radical SAM core domain-containing protein n=1 Tax=uncultured bacterium (gcode 4) TaxID=1234023 RepID=K2G2L9_9BACT|nr:MAG: hypothetical protein ACD_3C00051G0010 [uncultured bacterium (gcode 4)]